MCGIAGYLCFQSEGNRDLRASLQALHHRGPDDFGIEIFRSAQMELGLGSTRLAIVDISPAGHMPMCTADGSCAIAFNGEIYDAGVHRERLKRQGIRFRSRTDTEVLLYGLAQWGPAFLDDIDGMYAFAFWKSGHDGGLLIARDRFGEKPLFVLDSGTRVLFSSEIMAMITLAGSRPEVNVDVLRHCVEWGYPPPGDSILRGVTKLQPGEWAWYGSQRLSGRLKPLASNSGIDRATTLKQTSRLVLNTLRDSVRQRLIADVPVGVFLSGGLDSAGIAALAVEALPPGERLNTYTVGYPDSDVSELDQARRVAQQLHTLHHEIVLRREHILALPFVAFALGEPLGDPAALPTYFLSAYSRLNSTVLLSGEGSDEILFGYPRYLLHDMADARLQPSSRNWYLAGASKLFKKVREAPAETLQRDRQWKSLGNGWKSLLNGTRPQSWPAGMNSASQARTDDLERWLPENVLTRVDRMTMAASIEARAPYLAREMARLGMHLPHSRLRRFPYGKVALRTGLKPYFSIWKRFGPKKPFAVPLIPWMLGPLENLFQEVFFGDRLMARGWFRPEGLKALGTAIRAREQSQARLAWMILMVELWARAFLDGEIPQRPEIQALPVQAALASN